MINRIKKEERQSDIEGDREYTLVRNQVLQDRTVSEIIRTIGAKQAETNYAISQFDINWKYIDLEARNVFASSLILS